MSKIDDFRSIFRTSFRDPARWQDWFFSTVVNDPDEIYLSEGQDGRAAASLLMQPYTFLYHGKELPTGYISCVATRPEARSRGIASALLKQALTQARTSGMAACSLIPAEDHLYFFYGKRGFATVFYHDESRYTSAHIFRTHAGDPVPPTYDILHDLELRRGCGILHSREDFAEILGDMEVDGNTHVLARTDGPDRAAILFAAEDSREIKVKCLMADTPELAESVLADLRAETSEKPVIVFGPPADGSHSHLRSYGMLRIVNPLPFVEALAESNPRLRYTIAVTDSILEDNTAVYRIADGAVEVEPYSPVRHDLDVSIEVLAGILFSSHRTGSIFELPTRRPYMALMLD